MIKSIIPKHAVSHLFRVQYWRAHPSNYDF